VRKFEEGTPQEWIDMLRDLGGDLDPEFDDRRHRSELLQFRALVRGESAVAFETSLQDSRTVRR
jgi:hypothetical protein